MNYFLDTEFNGFGGELISLALVREDGLSGYWVLELTSGATEWRDHTGLHPWVAENVIPKLWEWPDAGPRILWEPKRAARDIAFFLAGDSDPVIIADWPADIRYFCGLIELPDGQMVSIPRLAFRMVRVDAYPTTLDGAVQHNAWWDAIALRHKLTGRNNHYG